MQWRNWTKPISATFWLWGWPRWSATGCSCFVYSNICLFVLSVWATALVENAVSHERKVCGFIHLFSTVQHSEPVVRCRVVQNYASWVICPLYIRSLDLDVHQASCCIIVHTAIVLSGPAQSRQWEFNHVLLLVVLGLELLGKQMLHLKLGCMSLVLDSLLTSNFGLPVADGWRCYKPLEHATGCKFTKHVDIFGRFTWIVRFICAVISQ